jgi:hypothetical protein
MFPGVGHAGGAQLDTSGVADGRDPSEADNACAENAFFEHLV